MERLASFSFIKCFLKRCSKPFAFTSIHSLIFIYCFFFFKNCISTSNHGSIRPPWVILSRYMKILALKLWLQFSFLFHVPVPIILFPSCRSYCLILQWIKDNAVFGPKFINNLYGSLLSFITVNNILRLIKSLLFFKEFLEQKSLLNFE